MKPKICAVMVTGKPGRRYLATMAIRAFLEQDYPKKQLLIINDGEPVAVPDDPRIRQLACPQKATLGALRNTALDAMDADIGYVVQWDDDDYSHPSRLSQQVATVKDVPEKAVVFRHEIHCHLHTGDVRVCRPARRTGFGFAGTIMHPVPTEYRYPAVGQGEDTFFIRQWRESNRLHVVMNDPRLYVRFYHGLNTWPEKHVMGFPSAGLELDKETKTWLRELRAEYLRRQRDD